MINREEITANFNTYVAPYNASDEKIRLKIDHTFRVASLCEQIAESEKWSREDVDLAWFLGMLHDIGRFEQILRYGTFSDADSIDHANFGANLLFKEGLIERFPFGDEASAPLVETAIRNHSVYRLPEALDERTRDFCNILRDADKIDIFRVNVDIPLEKIYNTTTEELVHCVVTEAVMESFREKHATLRALKKVPVDHVVGHISLVYELVYPVSTRIVKEQGYLERLAHFHSEDVKAQEQFDSIRRQLREDGLLG